MLDAKMLADMPERTIFATGTIEDSPKGINMSNSKRMLRWVAVRGGIDDWAIYIHLAEHTISYVRNYGDKVCGNGNIRKLVPCDNEALKKYRK